MVGYHIKIIRTVIIKTQYHSTILLHVSVVLLNKIQIVRKLENKVLTFLRDSNYKNKIVGLTSDSKNSFPTSHVTARRINNNHC